MTDRTPSALASALVDFQAEMPTVAKGQTATIPGKDGRAGYSYKYADLADVSAAALPLLTKHGLAFTCQPRQTPNGGYELAGVLRHLDGETIEGALPLNGRTPQEMGSSLTYMRRYLLGCLTGLVTDEDDDGAGAQNSAPAKAEPLPTSYSKAQFDLKHRLDGLDGADKARVRSWWQHAQAPALDRLTDDEVLGVYVALAEGGLKFDGVEYPAPAEELKADPSEAR